MTPQEEIVQLRQQNARLAAILTTLADEMDNEADVIDVSDGRVRPNEAMRWRDRLKELYGDREKILTTYDKQITAPLKAALKAAEERLWDWAYRAKRQRSSGLGC